MKKRGGGGRLEHTPQYEKEMKRLENNIMETTDDLLPALQKTIFPKMAYHSISLRRQPSLGTKLDSNSSSVGIEIENY